MGGWSSRSLRVYGKPCTSWWGIALPAQSAGRGARGLWPTGSGGTGSITLPFRLGALIANLFGFDLP